jgi:hypothetical protein
MYPVSDVKKLIELLGEFWFSLEKRIKFGKASLELIKDFSYETIIHEIYNNLKNLK